MKLTITTLAAAALFAGSAMASIPGAGDPLPRDAAEGATGGFASSGVTSIGNSADRFTPQDRADMGRGDTGQVTVSTFSAPPSDAVDPTLYR